MNRWLLAGYSDYSVVEAEEQELANVARDMGMLWPEYAFRLQTDSTDARDILAIEWGYTDEGYIPIDTYRIETCDELEFMFLAGMAAVTKKVEV